MTPFFGDMSSLIKYRTRSPIVQKLANKEELVLIFLLSHAFQSINVDMTIHSLSTSYYYTAKRNIGSGCLEFDLITRRTNRKAVVLNAAQEAKFPSPQKEIDPRVNIFP